MVKTKDTFIRTFTGKMFSPRRMEEHNYDIRDIAHALSLTCRYNGHCKAFYSVAEHSCKIHDFVSSKAKYYGLMHDASEAYLSDIPKPIKILLPDYEEMETRLSNVITKSFLVPYDDNIYREVKNADKRIVFNEMLKVFPDASRETEMIGAALSGVEIECWDPRRAELEFLDRFKTIIDKSAKKMKGES